jgi:hypothetical protein
VTTALDPVVDRQLAETAEAWAHDTVDVAPHLPVDSVHALAAAALDAGYLFGRLLVGTADVDQQWSDEGDREELHGWLSQVVPMIDWSGTGDLIGADAQVTATVEAVVSELLREHGLAGDSEAAGRSRVFVNNGLCVALVEHSATRPLAEHVWVDLTSSTPAGTCSNAASPRPGPSPPCSRRWEASGRDVDEAHDTGGNGSPSSAESSGGRSTTDQQARRSCSTSCPRPNGILP